jgi:hypothetical protein
MFLELFDVDAAPPPLPLPNRKTPQIPSKRRSSSLQTLPLSTLDIIEVCACQCDATMLLLAVLVHLRCT